MSRPFSGRAGQAWIHGTRDRLAQSMSRPGTAPRARKRKNIKNVKQALADQKYMSFDSTGGTLSMVPTTAARVSAVDITSNIALGDLVTNRSSNRILLNRFYAKFKFQNEHTTARYIRFFMVSLRGSSAAADTTNWTDLLTRADYTKSGLASNCVETVMRINQDEYKLHIDKQIRVPGTGDGVPNIAEYKLKKKLKHEATYLYNSAQNRSGNLHFGWFVAEECGNAPNAAAVNCEYSFTMYFKDI